MNDKDDTDINMAEVDEEDTDYDDNDVEPEPKVAFLFVRYACLHRFERTLLRESV